LVKEDPETGEQNISLRLRKKKYMKGIALQGFNRLDTSAGRPNAQAESEASLPLGKFQLEPISLEQLQERLAEIIKGETNPR
jgi:hypothetical protein